MITEQSTISAGHCWKYKCRVGLPKNWKLNYCENISRMPVSHITIVLRAHYINPRPTWYFQSYFVFSCVACSWIRWQHVFTLHVLSLLKLWNWHFALRIELAFPSTHSTFTHLFHQSAHQTTFSFSWKHSFASKFSLKLNITLFSKVKHWICTICWPQKSK